MLYHDRKYYCLFLLLTVLTAFCYLSCVNDPCGGVVCLNGGTCHKRDCVCPSGYEGARCENFTGTSLTYHNSTFTPVQITINGATDTIPVNGEKKYYGGIGAPANGTATTSGMMGTGIAAGLTITWSLHDVFPEKPAVKEINVSNDYFYLKLINKSPYPITQVNVNPGHSTQTTDNITLLNTGIIYDIGYYQAFPTTSIVFTAGPRYWSTSPALDSRNNQSYIYTAY